jgi:DeoR/GlpR family transcriptional regulator of sugar metabolism
VRKFESQVKACNDAADVVRLLLRFGRRLGVRNVRYHRLDEAAESITCLASAGLDPQIEQRLRLGVLTKSCRFLSLEKWDSMWAFKIEAPTLMVVSSEATLPLQSQPGPGGIPCILLPEDQCSLLKGFKGPLWIDFPFRVGLKWRGKLSCDYRRARLESPSFHDDVMLFWELVKIAGVYLECFSHRNPAAPVVDVADANSQTLAQMQYAVTHGKLDVAAIATCVAQHLRRFEGQAVAIDGGKTNRAIAEAIVRDIRDSRRGMRTIMTNNLEIPLIIPPGEDFPSVELTGGTVRRKHGKPGDVVGDESVIERIRSWSFGAAVIGTSGINPPGLFTGTGQDHDMKRAFMQQAATVIVPIPGFKWGKRSGRRVLDVGFPLGAMRELHLITVFPHEDATEPRNNLAPVFKAQEDLLDGLQVLANGCSEIHFQLWKASFHPNHGMHASIDPVDCGELDDCLRHKASLDQPLREANHRINPDKRSDIRLLIGVHLPLPKSVPEPRREVSKSSLLHV